MDIEKYQDIADKVSTFLAKEFPEIHAQDDGQLIQDLTGEIYDYPDR